MTVFLTADLHLGHKRVAELRRFDSPAEHDAVLFERWRSVVRSGDQVWVLGDVTLSNPKLVLPDLAALPGEKHLIAGNHDRCHPLHRDSHKWLPVYLQAFASVQLHARHRIEGREVLLSHFPYSTDRPDPDTGYVEARYPQWRLPDLGVPLLHGHTHSPKPVTSDRELHLGLDAHALTPVPLEHVAAWLDTLLNP